MNIKSVIKKILYFIKNYKIKKKVTLIGKNHYFHYNSSIVRLKDNSVPSDIILHDNVMIFGELVSSNHGNIVMEEFSKIGINSKIYCVNHIKIGKFTSIGDDTTIVDNNNHPINPMDRKIMRCATRGSSDYYYYRQWRHSVSSPIIIGENIWIGSNVRICKGVTIGNNSIIAACSVVTKDVPENSIAAGNPAKIVKTDIDKTTISIFMKK